MIKGGSGCVVSAGESTIPWVDGAGWLSGARRVPSPNANERPEGADISLLVLHNISLPPGQFGGDEVERFFCNSLDPQAHPYFAEIRDLTVSAHLFIRRDGEAVQFVPLTHRAWHAGRSMFEGREECNDFSIGIELEGTDDEPYTAAQYQSLVRITSCLMACFPAITPERIVGHEHIAPDRKTDPGPFFDWKHFLNELAVLHNPAQDRVL